MPGHAHTDLTFLAARLHGRRSRMAEAQKLDELCGLQNVAELSRRVLGGIELAEAPSLQKELTRRLVVEVLELRDTSQGPLRALLDWELLRFVAANLKVLLRGLLNHVGREQIADHLIDVPGLLPSTGELIAAARSVRELSDRVPQAAFKAPLSRALRTGADLAHPFVFEAALDQAWLQGMLERAEALSSGDAELVREVVAQEARIFHLMLVLRGSAQQGLDAAALLPWRVDLGPAERRWFAAAVTAPRSVPDASHAESLAWSRFLRLANRAFRRSPMGEAAVAGYAAIRRIELANLITVSEGIRAHMPAQQLRSRLIPRGVGHA